jgi:hypothetical protein
MVIMLTVWFNFLASQLHHAQSSLFLLYHHLSLCSVHRNTILFHFSLCVLAILHLVFFDPQLVFIITAYV